MEIQAPKTKTITKNKALEVMLEWYPDFQGRMNETYADGGRLQKFVDYGVLNGCRPYLPFDQGALTRSGEIATVIGSGTVRWLTPYARFLYYGKLMVGEKSRSPFANFGEKKVLTDQDLVYQGGGKRGAKWFEHWKADHFNSFMSSIGKEFGVDVQT